MAVSATPNPGVKTTEFWMNIISLFLTAGMSQDPELVNQTVIYVPAAISGVYTIGRSVYKAFSNMF